MKLIIDVDTGMDDAQALLLALRSPQAQVLAVTCIGGNVPLDLVVRNTRLVVAAANWPGQPAPRVFAGCSRPLVSDGDGEIRATHYHGSDGIAGAWEKLTSSDSTKSEVEAAVNSVPVESMHAALGLIELVSQNKGEVTLLALAPLTNIALALRLEPRLGTWLRSLVVMGGAYQSMGNNERHLSAEFNFVHDPEAARLVLHEMLPCPRLIVPYEACLESSLPFDWAITWAAGGNAADEPKPLWRRLHELIVSHQCLMQRGQTFALTLAQPLAYRSCDLLAASICLLPSVASDVLEKRCTIELAGGVTRGQLAVDWFDKADRGLSKVATVSARFVTKVALDAYRELLVETLGE
ncbi:hypothetical protein BOX15_Mlig032881g1 [Macrostomum lignano]|uniref:Inosine/uridine-preferring nucleoside hydrolase domain-containing protein n=2 Tax=Macrostomum lignano TaxID=282301 RepID=A0A267GEM5_9PLAT|nr:hypothetical protein BOX15_Mlig032881g1 [Macrostomum lignano]